uniref:NADH-ubiquinone oxidoreductase chain 2 n=1 Tax=Candida bohioensis TaxID=561986 RepID=U3MF17_9ASCO|nr:NADH dehydrogenase subunit 2 [Candida bohioensis]AGW07348.1 NADH dehydrogenase subunit 2 [Candida bohioensis]
MTTIISVLFMIYAALIYLNQGLLSRTGIVTACMSMHTQYVRIKKEHNMTTFNDWLNINDQTLIMQTIMLMLLMSLFMYLTVNKRHFNHSKWMINMMFFNAIGLLLLPAVNDLFMFYIIIELQSYSLYILTSTDNTSYNATRSGMLYFLTGGLASVLIIFGSGYVYYKLGTTNIYDMTDMPASMRGNEVMFGMYTFIAALVFKMGLAPLHSWSMSVYNYAPTFVTAYMSIVAKLSITGWLFCHNSIVSPTLATMVFFMSMVTAAVVPLHNTNTKVMLAYSGMLNFSYLLLPMMTRDVSYYIYLMQYSMTHLMMFLCLLASNSYMAKPHTDWSPIVMVKELKVPNKMLSFCLMLCLFSLIGMPPLPGFYGKYTVMTHLTDKNYYLPVMFMIMLSVTATYYYAFIIKMLISELWNRSSEFKPMGSKALGVLIGLLMLLFMTFYLYQDYILEGLGYTCMQ